MPHVLEPVQNAGEVREAVQSFNADARNWPDVARSLLRTTRYWVLDPRTKAFGPGKFAGYRSMSFNVYRDARQGDFEGARFDGGFTHLAIEAATEMVFDEDASLAERLKEWGNSLLGEDAFGGIDEAKWRFVVLPA